MANNHRCGGCGRRNSNNLGCLNSVGGRWNRPYYNGPCPDVEGEYGDDRDNGCDNEGESRCNRCDRCEGAVYGLFTATQPIAVAANGIVPLSRELSRNGDFAVNSGMITLRCAGTYLAIYTVRASAAAELQTTMTLNVNGASQTSAIAVIEGAGTTTAQAIFTAEKADTVTLRSSEAINVTDTSVQPMFTLVLVRLED